MPMDAIKALEGKLAEGVDAIDVLSALKEVGWTAPKGGDYNSKGPSDMGEMGEMDEMEGDEEKGHKGPGAMFLLGAPGPEKEPKGYGDLDKEKPKDASDRMSLIARKAMKKDGADYEA
jgi:hypothetical protein